MAWSGISASGFLLPLGKQESSSLISDTNCVLEIRLANTPHYAVAVALGFMRKYQNIITLAQADKLIKQ